MTTINTARWALDNLNEEDHEEFEERAAIIEYCAGTPRAAAEKVALQEILKRAK